MSSAAAADRGHPGPAPFPARPAPPRTLLLGMGNPILCDDRVGHELARRIAEHLGAAPGLEVEPECTVGGLNLLELADGFDRLIVVDSIKTRGGRPGDWYSFDGTALRDTMNLSNVHDANFATAMELGRRLGMHLPGDRDIHIFAAEVSENLTFGERLSPQLEDALPEVCREMLVERVPLPDLDDLPRILAARGSYISYAIHSSWRYGLLPHGKGQIAYEPDSAAPHTRRH